MGENCKIICSHFLILLNSLFTFSHSSLHNLSNGGFIVTETKKLKWNISFSWWIDSGFIYQCFLKYIGYIETNDRITVTFGRKCPWLNISAIPAFRCRYWGEPWKVCQDSQLVGWESNLAPPRFKMGVLIHYTVTLCIMCHIICLLDAALLSNIRTILVQVVVCEILILPSHKIHILYNRDRREIQNIH